MINKNIYEFLHNNYDIFYLVKDVFKQTYTIKNNIAYINAMDTFNLIDCEDYLYGLVQLLKYKFIKTIYIDCMYDMKVNNRFVYTTCIDNVVDYISLFLPLEFCCFIYPTKENLFIMSNIHKNRKSWTF